MATRIRRKTNPKQVARFKRKRRIRARVEGTAEKPRLSVFRSNANLYVQLVDDIKGNTLVAASTLEEETKKKLKANKKAWRFFDAQAPWYKRTAIHWVMSAKQEATREKRLAELIADSANGERIKQLRRTTTSGKKE